MLVTMWVVNGMIMMTYLFVSLDRNTREYQGPVAINPLLTPVVNYS